MMDGCASKAADTHAVQPATGQLLDSLTLPLDDRTPWQGERYEFDGGTITLRARGPFELYFRSAEMDLISFSLDQPGDVLVSVNGEEIRKRTLMPGHGHFHPAGTTVYVRLDDGNMQIVAVALHSSVRREMLRQLGWQDIPELSVTNLQTPMTEALGQRLRDFIRSRPKGASMVAETLATSALHDMLLALSRSDGGLNTAQASGDGNPIQKALDFIDANLQRDISLGEIATVAGKSPFHFARIFKDALGVTPVAYVIEKRIDRSKALLRQSDLPISVIATRCGFNSQSHYCRTFRRLEHRTPREYRRSR